MRTPAMVPDAEPACPWTFEDCCLWVSCLVNERWPQIAPRCQRPGPAPACSDPELVTMALVGEWARHRALFPHQPERSRCNRRRRHLQGAINELRRLILGVLDVAQGRQCVLDSRPVPSSASTWSPTANAPIGRATTPASACGLQKAVGLRRQAVLPGDAVGGDPRR